ncbi:hypothetical protein [Parabacteroides sp. PF5-6]|uniref:hypothetical protein n=1 Tax=Parabacteroides sp. PF5-6 TaxID=1742403 RepID=UPI0024065740|nr:hypothetical protein [Parabacteroides sp. PF5-6]MDF9830908.1 Cu/Ag efflux protein CusF [Parabacteroides sp. PF5-6]
MRRRVLIIAALLLVITTGGIWGETSGIWTDYVINFITDEDISDQGNGSEATPYKITKPEHLAYVALQVVTGTPYTDIYFSLEEDLDLEEHYWRPIGSSSRPFRGNFNGNNHTIRNLFIGKDGNSHKESGLWGYVVVDSEKTLTIKNLIIKDAEIIGGQFMQAECTTGGIIGLLKVYGTFHIENCSFSGSVTGGNVVENTSYAQSCTGGIMGRVFGGSASTVSVTNCSNNGTIKGGEATWSTAPSAFSYMAVGGIIGTGNSNNTTISQCSNIGDIEVGEVDHAEISVYTGGIVGHYGHSIIIDNCYSYCTVTTSIGYAGGLVGELLYSVEGEYRIKDSYAAGNIVSPSGYSGGLVGVLSKKEAPDVPVVENCLAVMELPESGNRHRVAGRVAIYDSATGYQDVTDESVIEACFGEGNYAYVESEGDWTPALKGVDGADWSGFIESDPISGWDLDDVWDISKADTYLPRLKAIDALDKELQPDVPNLITIHVISLSIPESGLELSDDLQAGEHKVKEGDDFSFSFTLTDNANYVPEITVGEGEITPEYEDGTYTVILEDIDEDKEISITLVQQYTVTLSIPESGLELSGDLQAGEHKVKEGDDFSFSFTLTDNANYVPEITVGEGEITPEYEDGTYTVTLEDIEEDKDVSITLVQQYTVTLSIPESGLELSGDLQAGEHKVKEGDDFSFSFTLTDNANYVPEITVGEGEITPEYEDGTYTVTLEDIEEDKDVSITLVQLFAISLSIPKEGLVLLNDMEEGSHKVKDEEDFSFSFVIDPDYRQHILSIMVNGEKVEAEYDKKTESYQLTLLSVMENKDIIISLIARPIFYHTITLEIAHGIQVLGHTISGPLSVSSGDAFYLQFLPEDRSLTAEDVMLLIDGVDTPFTDFGNNHYFSYILNPISADHTIAIALREYTVTLPETEGVTFDIGAGEHRAAFGEAFRFTVNPGDVEDLKVRINGILLEPVATGLNTLTYHIDPITGPVTVTLEGMTTSNADIAKSDIHIAIDNGQLTIDNGMANAVDVTVYTITGQNVVSLRALRGSKTLTLRPGIYLVKVADTVYKVSVH